MNDKNWMTWFRKLYQTVFDDRLLQNNCLSIKMSWIVSQIVSFAIVDFRTKGNRIIVKLFHVMIIFLIGSEPKHVKHQIAVIFASIFHSKTKSFLKFSMKDL